MFALPGIMVQNAMFTTLNTGVGLTTDLDKGYFDRLRSMPIARYAPLAGRIAADVTKQAWSIVLILGVGLALGFRVGTSPQAVLAAFGLMIVSAVALSWPIVLISMLVAKPEKVQIFGFVVLFPLTFMSDAFTPTATMPGALQAISKANPVSLLAEASRGLLVSGPVARPAIEAMAYAVGLTVVFAPLAVRAFKRR